MYFSSATLVTIFIHICSKLFRVTLIILEILKPFNSELHLLISSLYELISSEEYIVFNSSISKSSNSVNLAFNINLSIPYFSKMAYKKEEQKQKQQFLKLKIAKTNALLVEGINTHTVLNR